MTSMTKTRGCIDQPRIATRGGVCRSAVHLRVFCGALSRTLAVAALLGGTVLSAPTAAHATPVLDYYKQLPEDERRSIEYDLIWIGGTDAVTNGVVGRQSVAAIKEFERRIGTRADSILRPRERRALARSAERAREDAGYEVVIDEATGAAVGVPFAYVDEPISTRLGARYEAADGAVAVETYRVARGPDLRQIYRRQIARPGREVTYEVFRGEWFVVAGREGGRRFYSRARTDGDEVRAYTIDYDPSLKPELEAAIVAMSNDFEAFASDPAYRQRTPRRVEARAERDAPEGCPAEITVRAGETLRRIAQRCGVTVRDLRLANDRIRPRELQAGQTLFIPDAAPRTAERVRVRPPAPRVEREVVTVYQPTAVYLPRRPREDGRVRVSATGFPPETEVEVGFLRGDGRYIGVRDEVTDERGALEFALRLPDRFEDGTSAEVLISTINGTYETTAGPFTIRARNRQAPPRRERIQLIGMLTSEGESCPTVRDADGTLYTLAETGLDYAPGTPVIVEGFRANRREAAECGQGETVSVETVARR